MGNIADDMADKMVAGVRRSSTKDVWRTVREELSHADACNHALIRSLRCTMSMSEYRRLGGGIDLFSIIETGIGSGQQVTGRDKESLFGVVWHFLKNRDI